MIDTIQTIWMIMITLLFVLQVYWNVLQGRINGKQNELNLGWIELWKLKNERTTKRKSSK